MWHPHVKAGQSSFRRTGHNPDSLGELRIYGHVHVHIHFLQLLVKSCICRALDQCACSARCQEMLSSEKKNFIIKTFCAVLDATELHGSLSLSRDDSVPLVYQRARWVPKRGVCSTALPTLAGSQNRFFKNPTVQDWPSTSWEQTTARKMPLFFENWGVNRHLTDSEVDFVLIPSEWLSPGLPVRNVRNTLLWPSGLFHSF